MRGRNHYTFPAEHHHDGRPRVDDATGYDELLQKLIEVYGCEYQPDEVSGEVSSR